MGLSCQPEYGSNPFSLNPLPVYKQVNCVEFKSYVRFCDSYLNWNFIEMWIHDNYLTSIQIPKNPVHLQLFHWDVILFLFFFFPLLLERCTLCIVYFIFTFLIEKIIRSLWHGAQFSHIHNRSHHNSNKHDFFPQIEVEISLNRIMKDYFKSQYGASPCHGCEDLIR